MQIPTEEEIVEIIERRLKQTALEKPAIPPVIVEFETRIAKVEQALQELTRKFDALPTRPPTEAGTPNTMEQTVRTELGALADLLEFRQEKGELILKPRKFLGRQNFKNVIEIVRKHDGAWSQQTQTFTVRR